MPVELGTIREADRELVAAFLSQQMEPQRPTSYWLGMMQHSWPRGEHGLGVYLRDDTGVVGAYLAYYSFRRIAGRDETICNLGTWCVHPEYRFHSLRLLKALLSNREYHFTDLSPNHNVIALNRQLGFIDLVGTQASLLPNLPWLGRAKISSDPSHLAASLEGSEFEIFDRHRDTAGSLHTLIESGNERCYTICRRDLKKGLPISTLLYVSDVEMLRRQIRPFTSHLLRRHRTVGCLIEDRFNAKAPLVSLRLPSPRRKMFRGPRLADAQIDYLYSELMCAP